MEGPLELTAARVRGTQLGREQINQRLPGLSPGCQQLALCETTYLLIL